MADEDSRRQYNNNNKAKTQAEALRNATIMWIYTIYDLAKKVKGDLNLFL